jgi:putative transposase
MRKPYPSDLTDEQWEIIKPLIPVNTIGRPRKVEMREVLRRPAGITLPAAQSFSV